MIARVLSRYADTRLRASLACANRNRRRLAGLLRDARAETRAAERLLRDRDREIGTLRVLEATWQRIARQAQDQLAAERARTQETTR